MKKFFVIFIALLFVVPVFGQWQYDNLSGVQPKVRVSIEELRLRAGLGVSAFAIDDIWFVDANNGADTQGGRSWDKAVATITKGLTLAGDYDVILVAPGDYEELETQNITEAYLQIYGPGIDNQHVAMVYVADSSQHAFTVNAHNVVISGLGFTVNEDGYDAIRVSTTASYHKTTISNCRFDGYGAGEYAIHTGTTFDSPDIVVQNCVFRSWQTACVYANATRGVYRNNHLITVAAKIGFNVVPTTGSRPDQVFKDNVIQGKNSTDTGFYFTGSPTESMLTMTGNSVTHCATPVTLSKYTSFYEGNYWGVEDWRYHRETGRSAATARGSDGNLFYCDGNMSATGDGKCWASASKVLAEAIALSQADIAANRNWARRNTIYVLADQLTESLVLWPQKTDVVGMGSDAAKTKATIKGLHVPATNTYYSTRWYNMRFQPTSAGVIMTLDDGGAGTQFHGCTFIGIDGAVTATKAIESTAHSRLVIDNCDFLGGFSGDVIDLAAGQAQGLRITNNRILGGANDGIIVSGTLTHYKDVIISDNYIMVEAVTINDGADGVAVINNMCISRAGTYGAGTHVITIGDAAGNIVVDKDGVAYTIPDLNVN